jgi:glycyl-tRNA synthetase beta chain
VNAALLVELLTEELPPKALKTLGATFATAVRDELVALDLVAAGAAFETDLATPRRLAVLISGALDKAAEKMREVQGPSTNAPAAAVAGFAKKNGVAPEALRRVSTPKGEVFVASVKAGGAALDAVLAEVVEKAIKKLPIPKLMRWGSGAAQFVRPVHGLVMLHGSRVVPGKVLDLESGNRTRGHRFLGKGDIVLGGADQYESTLATDGRVVANFAKRREQIDGELQKEAERQGGRLGDYHLLLDEVTALVEYPAIYVGKFDARYLEVPQECLILTMRQNQKYFPLFDAAGKLMARFLIVSNMEVADPRHIIGGNERVVRPRLEDARFFYEQDRRTRLEARVPQLARVVYHSKLGSQLERVQRLQLLAGSIARAIRANPALAERAAWLAKADLLTGMVGEFPELQGVMGGYYAAHDGEPSEVCAAIHDQYRLKLDGSFDPKNLVSVSLYLADRIEALVGLFGVGEVPTGEKDPFALRRAALGIIQAFELVGATHFLLNEPPPDVTEFLAFATTLFPAGKLGPDTATRVHDFILERYWHGLAASYPKQVVESVISQRPKLVEIVARVQAVQAFLNLPQAANLAAANKRIRNILRKSDQSAGELSAALLKAPEEKALYQSVLELEPKVQACMNAGQFSDALRLTAAIEPSVNAFFDKVMVNAEEPDVRANRHALLRRKLDPLMNQVADISKLAVEK